MNLLSELKTLAVALVAASLPDADPGTLDEARFDACEDELGVMRAALALHDPSVRYDDKGEVYLRRRFELAVDRLVPAHKRALLPASRADAVRTDPGTRLGDRRPGAEPGRALVDDVVHKLPSPARAEQERKDGLRALHSPRDASAAALKLEAKWRRG